MSEKSYTKYIGIVLDDRYQILEKIGQGGMAVVFRALDLRLNREVAIKIIRDELFRDADMLRDLVLIERDEAAVRRDGFYASFFKLLCRVDVGRESSVKYFGKLFHFITSEDYSMLQL